MVWIAESCVYRTQEAIPYLQPNTPTQCALLENALHVHSTFLHTHAQVADKWCTYHSALFQASHKHHTVCSERTSVHPTQDIATCEISDLHLLHTLCYSPPPHTPVVSLLPTYSTSLTLDVQLSQKLQCELLGATYRWHNLQRRYFSARGKTRPGGGRLVKKRTGLGLEDL